MPIKLIRSLKDIRSTQLGSVITIGNFDGVHMGHQALVKEVTAKAADLRAPSLLITFEPHPIEFFEEEKKRVIPRLTRLREKVILLSYLHIENILILKFNQYLANISANDFITDILFHYLRPRHIIIGDDFRFGSKRQGDFALLKKQGQKLGFEVTAMPTIVQNGERVSSTEVRNALKKGDLLVAKRLLGRAYRMMGRVGHGSQLGRQLGFPTANIHLHRETTPINGVYTVLVHGLSNQPLPGAANIGTRPAVDGTGTLLEVHLLDFNQDIYGRYVEVEFCEKLRDEEYYPTLDELRDQIVKDIQITRDYFKN